MTAALRNSMIVHVSSQSVCFLWSKPNCIFFFFWFGAVFIHIANFTEIPDLTNKPKFVKRFLQKKILGTGQHGKIGKSKHNGSPTCCTCCAHCDSFNTITSKIRTIRCFCCNIDFMTRCLPTLKTLFCFFFCKNATKKRYNYIRCSLKWSDERPN